MSSDGSVKAAADGGSMARWPSGWRPVWQWMVRHPVATILLITAILVVPTLWSRELNPPDELRHAAVFIELMDHGNWLALHMNGGFYPDKPPVYFWLLAVFSWIFQTDSQSIFYFVTGLTGAFLALATYQMARVVGRSDREFGLVVALVLLTNVFFVDRIHVPKMDLLFSTFICLSLTAFFAAIGKQRAWSWSLAAFGFATLAALTKGPFGLVVPLLTSLAYLAVTRNLSRLATADIAAGFVLSAGLLLLYCLGLYWQAGEAFLNAIFGYVDHKAGWSGGVNFALDQYVWFLLSRWLPWTLLLFFVPWRRMWNGLSAGGWRDPINNQWIFPGLAVACTLLPLSSISYVNPNFLIIVLAPLAVLSAALIVEMPSSAQRWFITTIGACTLLVGIVFPTVALLDGGRSLGQYDFFAGSMAVVAALVILRMRNYGFKPFLMILMVSVTLISLANSFKGSAKNEVRSTKPAGEAIAQYIQQGYKPFSLGYADFGVFFQYHARHRLPQYRDWNTLIGEIQNHDRVVIISTTRAWELWPERPAQARLVHKSPKNPSLSKNYDWMNNEPAVFVLEKNRSDGSIERGSPVKTDPAAEPAHPSR